MGIAAGGNINPEPGGTSMYEPIGGSAPKYTGMNVINPLAAVGALAMLLQNSGKKKAGDRVENAIKQVTPKLESLSAGHMGYSTTEVGDLPFWKILFRVAHAKMDRDPRVWESVRVMLAGACACITACGPMKCTEAGER